MAFLLPQRVLAVTSLSDIDSSSYKTAIQSLYGSNTIGGYPDGTFRPELAISRAEFLKIIVSSATKSYGSDTSCFSNIGTEWFAPFVCYAKNQGIISGYSDNTFRPESYITLAEATKIILAGNQIIPAAQNETWYTLYI